MNQSPPMLITIIIIIFFISWLLIKSKKKIVQTHQPPSPTLVNDEVFLYYTVCENDTSNHHLPQSSLPFTNGDLITRKYDAEAWFNRRTATITSKQQLLDNRQAPTETSIELWLVACDVNGVTKTYLLKDAHGDNITNRQIEAELLHKVGFTKASPINRLSTTMESITAKNSFLDA